MCAASDFVVGAVRGQKKRKKLHEIYYASVTLDNEKRNYATTEKELLAVVFAFEIFCPYLVGSIVVVHTDHAALKYLMQTKDSKTRVITWIRLLQEFDIEVKVKRGVENGVDDHLSQIRVDDDVLIDYFLPTENDEPYLYKHCSDGIYRRYVAEFKVPDILFHCHGSDYAGHFVSFKTVSRILQAGF
ncbi:hypothetical protein N665_0022s0003 [Sinapis alba]|nr:hypothetical protein N665_0022s0003 [Sinapis alba]